MKVSECTFWIITLFLLQNAGDCLTTKRRLCVEYKKENYLDKSEYITTVHADTEGKCMASCVRRYPCMAFNYHIINKTCILMRRVNCMAPSSLNNPGYLFVHLQACKLQSVWFSVRPADRGWHWVTTDDPGKNADIINVPGSFDRYVSRTLYRGHYLPGWWQDDKSTFRTVEPATTKATKCPYGEFLAYSNSSYYVCIPYTIGDWLPDCALPVSQLPNGTSLYTVECQFIDMQGEAQRIFGFYSHVAKSTYFVYHGVLNPTSVDILCGTDIWITSAIWLLLGDFTNISLKYNPAYLVNIINLRYIML